MANDRQQERAANPRRAAGRQRAAGQNVERQFVNPETQEARIGTMQDFHNGWREEGFRLPEEEEVAVVEQENIVVVDENEVAVETTPVTDVVAEPAAPAEPAAEVEPITPETAVPYSDGTEAQGEGQSE